ncbi:hypothetical protein GOPIP_072_00220 [Gordonia polyisoprenivorans NBRC 16320 = JCM 10675]|nr:hypothetical protein GOPIP_072_00220 [Gordonia polyisoprenivorans NBRC 16320 = JCM 10675]
MITQETSATAGITHIAFMSGTLRFGARGDGVFARDRDLGPPSRVFGPGKPARAESDGDTRRFPAFS